MDEPEIPRRVTVRELRAALADVDGDLPVVVVAYEGGFRNLSRAMVATICFGDRGYASQHGHAGASGKEGDDGPALFLGDGGWAPYGDDVITELISTNEGDDDA